MPSHWKIRKKWNSHREISDRTNSKHHKDVPEGISKRRQTIGTTEALNSRMSKSNSMLHHSSINGPEPVYPTGRRQFMRRHGILVNGNDDLTNTEDSNTITSANFITVTLEDGNLSFKKTVPIRDNRTVEELLATVLHKKGIPEEAIPNYQITVCRGGVYSSVDLDDLAMEYMASVIELKPLRNTIERSNRTSSSPTDHLSVKSCLEYFEANDLVEIPSNVLKDEEDSFHLPRVDPLDPIESSWEDLDIEPNLKQSLSNKEASQQQAIWELIATEHSFLRQLEVVINLFMQSLELIRRSGLLTEVNYQNVFGYMEDIYLAHVQFWYMTLLPCLEKVRQEHTLLDLNEIILRFPVEIANDFDVYEQHCAFEQTNLKSLNEAMNQKDFKTYLEWCESQPQCERLKLKDFLAKPMQRLTKYSLLLKAILSKTTNESHISELEHMIEETSTFVNFINGVLRAQEETQRVEEVMKNIIGYNPIELMGEFKELVQPYLQLDLLAPMPDVDMTRPRILIVEGKLRYRDNHTRTMVVHVFLFSDMLLITKMKGVDRYVIIKPPFKISQLQVTHKDSGTITCIVFNDYNVLTDLFTLKAHSAEVAQGWVDHIASAQEFYNAAMECKAQSWRLLESLQQKRILHGISLDVISPPDSTGVNGTHWSTQSISGSPVPSHEGFRRVPSCESTSSSVFPVETIPTPRQERRLSSLRAASFDQSEHRLSLNLPNSRSTPPLENHRVSFPFCTNNVKSSPVLSQRPIWQRAQSLNTVCTSDVILAKKKESFQITLMDATTQTDFISDHTPHLSLDEDTTDELTTTDEEYSPIVNSPTTPISIVVSPSTDGSLRRTHHRTKSLPKHLSIDDTFDCQDSHHLSPTSPISPVHLHKDTKATPDDNTYNGVPATRHSFDSHFQRLNYTDNNPSTPTDLSTTLPSSFRFDNTISHSSTLNNFRSDSKFKLPLTKIHERDDEDIEDTPQELSYKMQFIRGGNLRRSRSNFELSYKPRGSLLKPPSPLTTHMHQSNEKLNSILSSSHERRYSPVLSPRVVFLGEEDEESDESADNKKMDESWLANVRKKWLEDIRKPGSNVKTKPQTEEKKKSFWANKRIKSAGPSKTSQKKSGGGFFGLFRGRAMSMESIVDPTKQSSSAGRPDNSSTTNSGNKSSSPIRSKREIPNPKSPKASPKLPRVSPMVSPKLRPRDISPSFSEICNNHNNIHSSRGSPKGTLRRQPPMCSSPIDIVTSDSKIDFDDNNSPKTVRNSLQLTPPTHRVIFLSAANKSSQHPPSISAPTSPDVNIRHRSMKVFPREQQQEPLPVL